MLTSVIFDLDGTLLDTLQDLADASNQVLLNQNFPTHTTESYKLFVGQGLQHLIKQIVPPGTDNRIVEKCRADFEEIYSKIWNRNCCPYRGINDMLSALAKMGVRMGVLSNKPHSFTLPFTDEFFPNRPFEIVLGQREGFARKPNPDVALDIAKVLGSTPENTFFVGDSGVDMQTAANSGMRSIGVTWGFRTEAELIENGAERIINHPKELLNYVISPS